MSISPIHRRSSSSKARIPVAWPVRYRSPPSARTGWTWIWLVFGSNAIAAYMFSELLTSVLLNVHVTSGGTRADVISFLFEHVFARIPDAGWAALTYSVSFTAVCFVPVWLLYRRGIVLKV